MNLKEITVKQRFCFNALAFLKQNKVKQHFKTLIILTNYYFKDKYTYWLILLLINQMTLQKQSKTKQQMNTILKLN